MNHPSPWATKPLEAHERNAAEIVKMVNRARWRVRLANAAKLGGCGIAVLTLAAALIFGVVYLVALAIRLGSGS